MISIVTACYGGFDRINPQAEQDVDCRWFAVVPEPVELPGPWEAVVVPSDEPPVLAAKRPKMLPRKFVPVERYSVWIDASMQVTAPEFAREAVESIRDGWAVWHHPWRDCIYDEAWAVQQEQPHKVDGYPIVEQGNHYSDEGHPRHGGLYACGTIARDHDYPLVEHVSWAWLAEIERWTPRDQVSFPVVCRRFGIKPGTFPLVQEHRNRWLKIHHHREA